MKRMPVAKAAEELGCSKAALYRMIQRGQVEHIRLPNDRIVVEQVEVDRIVEEGRRRRENAPQDLWQPPAAQDPEYIRKLEAMANGKAA